jgi:hypothetical protein
MTFLPRSPSCSGRRTSSLEEKRASPGDIDDVPSNIDARPRAKSEDFVWIHVVFASAYTKFMTRDALSSPRKDDLATSPDENERETAALRRENDHLDPMHVARAIFTRSDVGWLQLPGPVFVVARYRNSTIVATSSAMRVVFARDVLGADVHVLPPGLVCVPRPFTGYVSRV